MQIPARFYEGSAHRIRGRCVTDRYTRVQSSDGFVFGFNPAIGRHSLGNFVISADKPGRMGTSEVLRRISSFVADEKSVICLAAFSATPAQISPLAVILRAVRSVWFRQPSRLSATTRTGSAMSLARSATK